MTWRTCIFFKTFSVARYKFNLINTIRITMKFALALLLLSFVATVSAEGSFPHGPNLDETPGSLCANSRQRRYPEKIVYCERSVDSYLKNAIIQKYDRLFDYSIRSMKRLDFKVDHLIPLCAGGSNNEDNLWPQHKSIYAITDPIEPLLCEKMQQGKLLQAEAVKMIIEAKTNLNMVPAVMKRLKSL